MNPKPLIVLATLLIAGIATQAAGFAVGGSPSDAYLKPDLKVGEQLTDMFSKSVSYRSDGFAKFAHSGRYSGGANYVVTAVSSDGAFTVNAQGISDGEGPQPVVKGVRLLANQTTDCYKKQCSINDQTSGLIFNPYLWGRAPHYIHEGSQWQATIDTPWEAGPPGVEQIRVVSVDPANGEITLVRHGSGTGSSSDDIHAAAAAKKTGKPMTITTLAGKTIDVTMVPGKATWDGYTTIRKGVIVGDEIMVAQQVRFIAKDGKSYPAERRIYTLLDLANDSI